MMADADNPRILLADDEPGVLETTSAILELEGYEVLTAQSGAEALEKARQTPYPSLALLDMRMEPMSGVEVLAELKQQSPQLPTIMITAYSSSDFERSAYDLGAYALVRKPFDPEHLLHLVRTAMSCPVVLISAASVDFARCLSNVLSDAGHRAITITDNDQIVSEALTQRCDVLVLAEPPSESRLENLARVKPEIRVLFVTPTPPVSRSPAIASLISGWTSTLPKERILETIAVLRSRRAQ